MVYLGYLYIKSALEPVDPSSNENIKVEIPIGSSSSTIADILEENGIIKNGLIFRLYLSSIMKQTFKQVSIHLPQHLL